MRRSPKLVGLMLAAAIFGIIRSDQGGGQELPKLPQLEVPAELPKPGGDDVDPQISQDDPAAKAQAALRQQIEKKLGKQEDGQFILVFSNARPATIPANTPLPRGAKRLPNNHWLEVIYQVELAVGRAAAADLVLQFVAHTQKHPGANYDWGLVARQDDAAKAQQALQVAQAKYGQAAVTYRPRTPDGLRFFNQGESQFFNRLRQP
mgnify:CR=1 FL=1